MYWSGCITIITKTSISGELALLCRCSKNSMVKLSNIKITLKKGRHIQTTHTPMELVFYAMVWFILLTIFVLLSTIWCYLCCHVTQQLHNAMQLITARTCGDLVLVLNYFVFNYISVWCLCATSQQKSYGCQKKANILFDNIVEWQS